MKKDIAYLGPNKTCQAHQIKEKMFPTFTGGVEVPFKLRMIFLFFGFFLLGFLGPGSAHAAEISAKREAFENFTQSAMRSGRPWHPVAQGSPLILSKEAPVQDLAQEYVFFSTSDIPLWEVKNPNLKELTYYFKTIQANRPYKDNEHPELPRRIPWLFPDDGCHVRAALFNHQLEDLGQARGHKIFVFANMWVKTPDHPQGEVLWWFHVAPIFRLHEGLFVVDPSLFPQGPVAYKTWLKFLAPQGDLFKLRLVSCDPMAHNPHSRCVNGTSGLEFGALKTVQDFFYYEWNRQLKLGRDPLLVLGDAPPWTVP